MRTCPYIGLLIVLLLQTGCSSINADASEQQHLNCRLQKLSNDLLQPYAKGQGPSKLIPIGEPLLLELRTQGLTTTMLAEYEKRYEVVSGSVKYQRLLIRVETTNALCELSKQEEITRIERSYPPRTRD